MVKTIFSPIIFIGLKQVHFKLESFIRNAFLFQGNYK